jgi:hypothetical protein
MHQPTIAFDIGGEDRHEAPFQLGCFHIQISIALACGWAHLIQGRTGALLPRPATSYFFARCSPLFPWASVE